MKVSSGLLLGLLIFAQLSCSQSAHHEAAKETEAVTDAAPATGAAPEASPVASVEAPAEPPVTADALAAPAAAPPPAPEAPPRPAVAVARLIIYHADVRLKTTAMPRAAARLDSLVQRSGGYLSAATETHLDGEWRQETTIRVPPARFQALLSGLAGLGTVEEKKLSTDDVTAQHADVAARLQAKRAVEQQYTVLLTRANKIQDILAIEEKLNAVREEIEATQSRLKTLNDEVSYATISLTLYQPLVQTVPDAPVVSLGSRVVAAFYDGWQLLSSLLIGFVSLWPVVLLGAAGWWLWQRRRRPAPAAPAQRPSEPA